jgi:glycosyltransferase involved in cell wall biosynthesis
MSAELISVIVPVYNVEKYIAVCIVSILNQTYRNLELILVDDGSTDKSGEICDEYAGKDRRVIVCHKTNGGVASSRNTGIGMAKGRYICFIDSDDFVRGDYLEKLHTAILKSDSDMAICSWKEVEDDYYTADDKYDDLKYMIPEPDWLYHELMYNNLRFVFLWDKLYKKELFRDVVLDITLWRGALGSRISYFSCPKFELLIQ